MNNVAPLIGIPCRHDGSINYKNNLIQAQSEAYMAVIVAAGGIPFLIPLNLPETALRRLYDLASGIILAGGGDIDPVFLNETAHPTLSDVQADRDQIEITLCQWAVADNKPLLGICRGIQVMGIAARGTLWQDLPSQCPQATLHSYAYDAIDGKSDYTYLAHDVELSLDSCLTQIFGTNRLSVNSLHHQAVKDVPLPFKVTGHSSDGVVEVVELPDHPFYCGVQWHPEVLVEEHETARQLFKTFVEVCQRRTNV